MWSLTIRRSPSKGQGKPGSGGLSPHHLCDLPLRWGCGPSPWNLPSSSLQRLHQRGGGETTGTFLKIPEIFSSYKNHPMPVGLLLPHSSLFPSPPPTPAFLSQFTLQRVTGQVQGARPGGPPSEARVKAGWDPSQGGGAVRGRIYAGGGALASSTMD